MFLQEFADGFLVNRFSSIVCNEFMHMIKFKDVGRLNEVRKGNMRVQTLIYG